MYTTKQVKDELFQICQTHYVKMKILSDYMYKRHSTEDFIRILEEECYKEPSEINIILDKFEQIREKIQQHGGQIVKDPFEMASDLKKAGKLDDAYKLASQTLRQNPENEDGIIAFGWIMYEYMKRNIHHREKYLKIIKDFNMHCKLSINKKTETLKNAFLWSFRAAIKEHKGFANILFPEIMNFCQHTNKFIETRYVLWGDQPASAARTLIKDIRSELSDENYLYLIKSIGFSWFDNGDYKNSNFVTDKGEIVEMKPLAETLLNYHAKKLINLPTSINMNQEIKDYIEVLTKEIQKNPHFEWLPYYKIKLLIRVNERAEALKLALQFARVKNREFWVWSLLSELVEKNQTLNCLSAALLCKAKPEMLVTVQEKVIPLLVENCQFAQAKYELDGLIAIRQQKSGKVHQNLLDLKKEQWYSKTESAKDRDALNIYAEQGYAILYDSLPLRDIFITFINKEKNTINFVYMIKTNFYSGYFYSDTLETSIDIQVNQPYKVKMIKDRHKAELFKIWSLEEGDPNYVHYFIREDHGLVEKTYSNQFAFVDDVYIAPKLVEKYQLEDNDYIEYVKKQTFNKKKNRWSWSVVEVKSVKSEQIEEM